MLNKYLPDEQNKWRTKKVPKCALYTLVTRNTCELISMGLLGKGGRQNFKNEQNQLGMGRISFK